MLVFLQNQTKIVVDQWIAVEQQISSAARKVVAPQESTLLPHGFYVLVSAWAGSILAKNRKKKRGGGGGLSV